MRSSERGIALILVLFLTAAMSVLASSLMFLSQTETYASMNYRMMSQARYGAEAGVQKAGNFLFDTAQYQKPGLTVGDPLTNYDYTASPVKSMANGQPIVLSTTPGLSNYPNAATVTAFQAAATGTLPAGNQTVTYTTTARLLSMQTFDPYGLPPGGTPGVVQTWEITARGTLSGARPATVEVVALAEQPVWPANTYAAFATARTCGAMYFHGTVNTKSYDSTGLTGGTSPTLVDSGGNVGTNGNLDIEGHVSVNGNLYTPNTGVGACNAAAVNALTEIGNADVTGDMVKLPTTVNYPVPPSPNPMPPTTAVGISGTGGACAALGLASPVCKTSATDATIPAGTIRLDGGGATLSLPSLSLSGGVKVQVVAHASPAQVVNINSLTMTGSAKFSVVASASNQSVLVNVAGKNADGTDMATPVDFGGNGGSGGDFANDSTCAGCSAFDASMLQFIYAGPGTISFRGNNTAAATFYAPNANVSFQGTSALYGSMLGKTVTNGGNADIYYDRRLSRDFYVEGMQMLGTFNWKRAS